MSVLATFRSILLKGDEDLFAFVAIRSILSELARRSAPATSVGCREELMRVGQARRVRIAGHSGRRRIGR